jgi:hypothetical protein
VVVEWIRVTVNRIQWLTPVDTVNNGLILKQRNWSLYRSAEVPEASEKGLGYMELVQLIIIIIIIIIIHLQSSWTGGSAPLLCRGM